MTTGQRVVKSMVTTIVVATAALIAGSLWRPDDSHRLIRWWLIAIASYAVFVAVGLVNRALPGVPIAGARPRLRRRASESPRPDRVQQIERMITSSTWSSREFRARLRPMLAEIATDRMRVASAIDGAQEPAATEALLGSDVYTLLTTTVNDPGSDGRGVTINDIERIVQTLEAIGGPSYPVC